MVITMFPHQPEQQRVGPLSPTPVCLATLCTATGRSLATTGDGMMRHRVGEQVSVTKSLKVVFSLVSVCRSVHRVCRSQTASKTACFQIHYTGGVPHCTRQPCSLPCSGPQPHPLCTGTQPQTCGMLSC